MAKSWIMKRLENMNQKIQKENYQLGMKLKYLEDEKQDLQDWLLCHGEFLMGIIQEFQSELQAKYKMLVTFHKVEHFEKEARSEGNFPKRKEDNGKKSLLFKNGNKNSYTHCDRSGHWIEKLLYPQQLPLEFDHLMGKF